jgi:hypothetical protein
MLYPDKKNTGPVQETSKGASASSAQALRVIALIIAFISVFGFFLKILFF